MLKLLFWTEKGCPMNFHSSTVSSNLLLVINEFGAKISARVVGGSSLWVKSCDVIMAYTNNCIWYDVLLQWLTSKHLWPNLHLTKIPTIKKCSQFACLLVLKRIYRKLFHMHCTSTGTCRCTLYIHEVKFSKFGNMEVVDGIAELKICANINIYRAWFRIKLPKLFNDCQNFWINGLSTLHLSAF